MMWRPWADCIETHTAAVFFAGDFAVKVKKPVAFDFVDLRTKAARTRACQNEVALNSRLAPDVYLGVAHVPLCGHDSEPAVVMRRLPAEQRLSARLREDPRGGPAMIREIARVVAAFHAGQPPVQPGGDLRDRMQHLWTGALRDLTALEPPYGEMATDCLRHTTRYLAGREALFTERVAKGQIRDGHGDLQAEDIFMLPDGPRLLDCLEFDDGLRVDDVLDDVCFLAMDLERLGHQELATQLLTNYCEYTDEHHPASLMHFFIAYRAAVRARVSALRARQGHAAGWDQTHELLRIATDHLRLAAPVLLLVGGLPGSGKTTLSTHVADDRHWVTLSSDVLRKELCGVPSLTPAPAAWNEGIYRKGVTRQVYGTLVARASAALSHGSSVVLDACWADDRWRKAARRAATATSATLVEVHCETSSSIARNRLANRTGDASDATLDIRAHVAESFDAWPEATRIRTDAPDDRSRLGAVVDEAVTR